MLSRDAGGVSPSPRFAESAEQNGEGRGEVLVSPSRFQGMRAIASCTDIFSKQLSVFVTMQAVAVRVSRYARRELLRGSWVDIKLVKFIE